MSSDSESPEKKAEWKTLSTKEIYKNNWMRLREDTVISPTGSETVYGVVETPQATGVLAVTDENEVILIGQARYPVSTYSWEIIEGAVDEGEDAVTAAKRELKEEAGIEARSVFPLGSPFHLSNCRTNEVAHLYVATGLSFAEASPDDTELLQMRKTPISEFYEMVDQGEIQDAMTIVAAHRYRNLFNT